MKESPNSEWFLYYIYKFGKKKLIAIKKVFDLPIVDYTTMIWYNLINSEIVRRKRLAASFVKCSLWKAYLCWWCTWFFFFYWYRSNLCRHRLPSLYQTKEFQFIYWKCYRNWGSITFFPPTKFENVIRLRFNTSAC